MTLPERPGQPADPEPDLPADECTTAVLLRKVATLLRSGWWTIEALTTSETRVFYGDPKDEWIAALEDRAARLERRSTPPPAEDGARVRALVEKWRADLRGMRRSTDADFEAYTTKELCLRELDAALKEGSRDVATD